MNRNAPDGYTLERTGPESAEAFAALMHGVWAEMEDKTLFAVEDLDAEWVRERLGSGFGVAARAKDGGLAGMLIVCRYGDDEENLGRDLGVPPERLAEVCNMECAAVLPAHRGHGLEARMFAFAEAFLRENGVRLAAMTVSPDNAPSLASARKAGYRIALTKEKYGGMLRHVLTKALPPSHTEE